MQHYTILIIDDKREQAKEIKKKIEALHPAFHADIANDASYALKGTYDAYLSDLMMPVHSGIEIGNMIYKENPDAIIILMSSLDNFAIERTQQFPPYLSSQIQTGSGAFAAASASGTPPELHQYTHPCKRRGKKHRCTDL